MTDFIRLERSVTETGAVEIDIQTDFERAEGPVSQSFDGFVTLDSYSPPSESVAIRNGTPFGMGLWRPETQECLAIGDSEYLELRVRDWLVLGAEAMIQFDGLDFTPLFHDGIDRAYERESEARGIGVKGSHGLYRESFVRTPFEWFDPMALGGL
jgi:hypothetical protein